MKVLLGPSLCILGAILSTVEGNRDKVRLRDVDTITLQQGKYTNSRRSSPIPQLQCVGGSAGCGRYVPEVVQCYNKGWDGYDVQWECKADMDHAYRFGKMEVSCEGYSHPEDEYVLKGSCGLEYTVELTEQGKGQGRGSGHNSWGQHQGHKGKSSWGGSSLIFLGIMAVVVYIVWTKCLRGPQQDGTRAGPSAPPGPDGSRPPPPPGFRPEYMPGGPDDKTQHQHTGAYGGSSHAYPNEAPPPYPGTQQAHHSQTHAPPNPPPTPGAQPGRPGFWSGAGLGGVLGYMFGNRNGGYQQPMYGNGGQGFATTKRR